MPANRTRPTSGEGGQGDLLARVRQLSPAQRARLAGLLDLTSGQAKLAAAVVGQAGREIDTGQLRRFVLERLPEAAAPSRMLVMEALPRTAHGKVDRDALRAEAARRQQATAEEGEVASPGDRRVSETEHKLIEIWRSILKTPVSVEDNFLDLGGDSLQALKVVARAAGQGLRLRPGDLFRHRTLADFAAAVDARHQPPWSPLLPLQPRGGRPPFFAVHAIGGEAMFYRHLAAAVDDDQPFIGVQAIGLDGGEPADQSIEEMAARYVQAVVGMQPEGPYRLGGFSSGAVIAFEMARQLIDAGKTVDRFFALEGLPPGVAPPRVGFFQVLGRFVTNLPWWIKDDLLKSDWRRTGIRARARIKRLAPKWARRPRPEPGPDTPSPSQASELGGWAPLDIERVFGVSDLPAARLAFLEQHYRAVIRYQPSPLDLRIDIFRGRAQPFLPTAAVEDYWRPLARQGVDVHVVPGAHDSIFQPPNVNELAANLSRLLAGE